MGARLLEQSQGSRQEAPLDQKPPGVGLVTARPTPPQLLPCTARSDPSLPSLSTLDTYASLVAVASAAQPCVSQVSSCRLTILRSTYWQDLFMPQVMDSHDAGSKPTAQSPLLAAEMCAWWYCGPQQHLKLSDTHGQYAMPRFMDPVPKPASFSPAQLPVGAQHVPGQPGW